MDSPTKTVMFYTKAAGITAADAKRMEAEGYLCVRVRDPRYITTPSFGVAAGMPLNDEMALLSWQAMLCSTAARTKFGELLINSINQKLNNENQGT